MILMIGIFQVFWIRSSDVNRLKDKYEPITIEFERSKIKSTNQRSAPSNE